LFLRSVKAPNGRHEYLRLVESFREGDKVKQRIVAHLGRKDLLAPHLDTLVRLLQAEVAAPRWVSADQISTPRASTWGPILVARHLFDQLSLGSIYWTRAKRRCATDSRCRSESFLCSPIGSAVRVASMPWRNGWKIFMCAMLRANAGCRCGSNPAESRWASIS